MGYIDNKLILGKEQYYDTDDFKTRLNNNVVVVGSSGSGKTRGIVEPNILQAEGNYIILDPKGNLNKKYAAHLRNQGYDVQTLDFVHPERSAHYNCFHYIKNEQDILKISEMLVKGSGETKRMEDAFWDDAAELLVSSVIGYLHYYYDEKERTLENVSKLVANCTINENDSESKTLLDRMMENIPQLEHKNFTYKQYFKFRAAAGKTLKSIIITLNSILGKYDTDGINKMMKRDTIDITSFADKKRALFVIVSDTDRSMDGLVNLFFSQAMDTLCRYADENCIDSRLPRNVRFIMDDFGTNCKINNFQKIISNIRSRGISVMIMLQAESQLWSAYGQDAQTIIANCDTYVYMGGNDVETSKSVAERCNLPYYKILNMPLGTNWIFRRGQAPINGENFVLEDYSKIKSERDER